MRPERRLPLRTYRVTLGAHRVERWEIPAQTIEVPAAHAEHACETAVRSLHRAAVVPPWRPCLRASLAHAVAESGWTA
jgi:hypothetical protein